MTRLQDRLTRELGEIADRATTSPPTIETLRERALEAGPLDDEVVVRLSPAGTTRGRSIRG